MQHHKMGEQKSTTSATASQNIKLSLRNKQTSVKKIDDTDRKYYTIDSQHKLTLDDAMDYW